MTHHTLSRNVLNALYNVLGSRSFDNPVYLHEPSFTGSNAWCYLKDCLDTGWVSSSGQWVNRFEQELAAFTGASHVVAVSNGTVALRLALHLVGVKPNDEVLTSPLSFVATANAISHLGAVPHFVDINSSTLSIDPNSLSDRLLEISKYDNGYLINRLTGRRLAAIVPVDVFGHPADLASLSSIADEWGLPLVEDAAEALGSTSGNIHCGLFGSIGILSFNGNKVITTGGGGALLTNDAFLAERARHLSTTAKIPHPWLLDHDSIGWNDRMPNLNAALGVAQMEDIQCKLSAKRLLSHRYQKAFNSVSGVEFLTEHPSCHSNYWLSTIRLTSTETSLVKDQLNDILSLSHASRIFLRPAWKLLHKLPMYTTAPRNDLDVAEDQSLRLINLPSSPQLVDKYE